MVPVSIRTGDEEDPWTNRVGGIIADLPTNCDDPLERLRRCHEAMNEAKRQMDVLPADDIAELAQVAPPLAATAAMRLQSRLRLADRVNLPANVVISNVPGTAPRAVLRRRPKMTNYIPVSTIADDMGLNITVHSYLDRLDFGLIADRELVPDLWDLVDLHIARSAGSSRPPGPSGPRSSRHRRCARDDPVSRAQRAAAKKTAATRRPRPRRRPAKKTAARSRGEEAAAKKPAAAGTPVARG